MNWASFITDIRKLLETLIKEGFGYAAKSDAEFTQRHENEMLNLVSMFQSSMDKEKKADTVTMVSYAVLGIVIIAVLGIVVFKSNKR